LQEQPNKVARCHALWSLVPGIVDVPFRAEVAIISSTLSIPAGQSDKISGVSPVPRGWAGIDICFFSVSSLSTG
jgi:hypothetical protein